MATGLIEPLYTRAILRLAASIPGQKSFAEMGDAAILRSATCGSRVAMRVTLDGRGRVETIGQAVEACAFGQGAAALVGAGASLDSGKRAALAMLSAGDEESPNVAGIGVLNPARARRGLHGAILLRRGFVSAMVPLMTKAHTAAETLLTCSTAPR